jgi:hypothetical protein
MNWIASSQVLLAMMQLKTRRSLFTGFSYTPGAGNPSIAEAARSVLTSRHATVI